MNSALKNSEALIWILGITHIHAGFVVLHSRAAIKNPPKRRFQGDIEEKCHVRFQRITVELPNPCAVAAADGIASEGSENVSIREDDISGVEQRQDLPFIPVRKVRAVNQREGCWRQELTFLTFPRGFFDE